MPNIYNHKTNVDSVWMTAVLGTADAEGHGEAVVDATNPLYVQFKSSTDFDLISVAVPDDGSDELLHADLEAVEFVLQNESGSDVWWSKAGAVDAITKHVILHSGDVAALPFANLNMVQVRMATGSGAGEITVVARY